MADVKTQKSLMQSEIDSGSMYGDERIPRSNLTMPSDEMSEEEADDILGSVVAGHHGSAVQTVSFEPPEVEEPAPAKVVKPPVVAPAPPPPPAVVAERPAEPIVAEPVKAGVVPPPAPSEDMADLLEAMGLADKPSAPVPVKEAAPSVAKKEEAKPSLGVEAMSKASAKDDEDIDRFLKGNGKAAMDDDDLMALLT
jgi:outer membrane biosynthesis protein TonB